MINFQKTIKYISMSFALLLAISIISGIVYAISSASNIFGDNHSISNQNDLVSLDDIDLSHKILTLEVNIKSTNVYIKSGSNFKIETSNKYVGFKQEEAKLIISETSHSIFNSKNDYDLIIYIPDDYTFDYVEITNGAGKIDINSLYANKLYLNLGAGKVNIDKLYVSDDARIDGGAGEIIISDGRLNNLDLDLGVGKLQLTSRITGNNDVDCGVGEVNLNLIGSIDDYQIKFNKGLGSATLNKEEIIDGKKYGSGRNYFDIDGGIGTIKITTSER